MSKIWHRCCRGLALCLIRAWRGSVWIRKPKTSLVGATAGLKVGVGSTPMTAVQFATVERRSLTKIAAREPNANLKKG